MFKKKNHKNKPYVEMSTGQLIRHWLISKLPQQKEKIADQKIIEPVKFPNDDINYIAIVLDGVVEDVMRAQNRLAALLLSNPEFIEFDPKFDKPQIGVTRFKDGKFEQPLEELMTDEEISKTLEGMGVDVKDENKKQ